MIYKKLFLTGGVSIKDLKHFFEKILIRFLEFGSQKYSFLDLLPHKAKILDIGCGDCRRARYRQFFKDDIVQYGIDIRYNEECSQLLKEFFPLDINKSRLPFEDNFFDAVVLSHIIEHIPESSFIILLNNINRVLKRDGLIYIEFPSEKTKNFIKADTLKNYYLPVTTFNFYDDPTHQTLYSLDKLRNIIESSQLQINSYGEITEYLKKILSPILLFIGIVKQDSNITTGTLWSIFNWASYLIAEKSDTDYK